MDIPEPIPSLARQILANAAAVAPAHRRYMLGIAGIPAAGKSTLAGWLLDAVNARAGGEVAALLPMDGFHLPNDALERRGIRHLKGVPDTFDPAGFVRLLARARDQTDQDIPCPIYDRDLHAPVADALLVKPSHRIVITEGNYLLYELPPWDQIAGLLDEVWFVSASVEQVRPRLIARHMAGGRTRDEAIRKMESTDLPNAALVEGTKHRAHRVLTLT